MTSPLDEAFALLDDAKFEACLARLEKLIGTIPKDDREARADAHQAMGVCLDRLGDPSSDDHFRAANAADPGTYGPPLRLDLEHFEEIVAHALDELPIEFSVYLSSVSVLVQDYPGTECFDPFALGLYVGIPRTERDELTTDHPDTIYIYKRTHELEFPSVGELSEEIRKTVIHEVGHHFGLDEDAMGDYA